MNMSEYTSANKRILEKYDNACIDLAIEKACLRGDVKSVEINPLARKAILAALDL
jgi:hypothetical protein